jgi:hypothetical protein
MIKEAWIAVRPAGATRIRNKQFGTLSEAAQDVMDSAVTGFWDDPLPAVIYNVVGSPEAIQELIDDLGVQVSSVDGWIQGNGLDDFDDWPTVPSRILSFMKDHIEYDNNGNPVGSTPATYENPNWGHVFLGQSPSLKIFAGGFDEGFSGGMK